MTRQCLTLDKPMIQPTTKKCPIHDRTMPDQTGFGFKNQVQSIARRCSTPGQHCSNPLRVNCPPTTEQWPAHKGGCSTKETHGCVMGGTLFCGGLKHWFVKCVSLPCHGLDCFFTQPPCGWDMVLSWVGYCFVVGWSVGLPSVCHCLVMGWASFLKSLLVGGSRFCHGWDIVLWWTEALACQVCVTALS